MKKLKRLSLTVHWIIHFVSLMVGALVGYMSSQISTDVNIGIFIGFILILISFAWKTVFLKCPHCGYHFHLRQPVTPHCPNCGKRTG